MKTQLKRKRGKIQKSPKVSEEEVEEVEEVEETPPVRKTSKTRGRKDNIEVVVERKARGKEVNDKPVVVESNNNSPETRGKISRPKKKNKNDNVPNKVKNNVQIMIHQKDDNVEINLDKEEKKEEGYQFEDENEDEKDDEEGYQLEDEKEGDDELEDDDYELEDEQEEDYKNETSDSNSSSELIKHEKPYYGGRKKLPPRAAATQKIDYSENRYFHEFQDYFFTRLDDDNEPKRRKSLSTPTRERSSRKLNSDDDYYSNLSSSSQDNPRSVKRPRRKRLPNRESKEKSIDYSENKYYRQFDSALNAKLELSDDENDTDTDKKNSSGNGKNRESTPVRTPQKTPKTSPNKSNRSTASKSKSSRKILYSSGDEQVSDQENNDGGDSQDVAVTKTKKVRGRKTVE